MTVPHPNVRRIETSLARQGLLPPEPGFLGQLAQHDPRLASALIRPDLIGWGETSCGWGWEIINLRGTFSGTAADQRVPFNLQDGIVEVDLWVRKVTYTVKRPSAFDGNVLKAQSDYFNSLNPNIDFRMSIKSYCNYLISANDTPLENIPNVFECVCPFGFVLGCNSNISGQFTNTRTFQSDESDTEAVISMHCVRLPTRYDSCGVKAAAARLWKMGILSDPEGGVLPLQGTPESADGTGAQE